MFVVCVRLSEPAIFQVDSRAHLLYFDTQNIVDYLRLFPLGKCLTDKKNKRDGEACRLELKKLNIPISLRILILLVEGRSSRELE